MSNATLRSPSERVRLVSAPFIIVVRDPNRVNKATEIDKQNNNNKPFFRNRTKHAFVLFQIVLEMIFDRNSLTTGLVEFNILRKTFRSLALNITWIQHGRRMLQRENRARRPNGFQSFRVRLLAYYYFLRPTPNRYYT